MTGKMKNIFRVFSFGVSLGISAIQAQADTLGGALTSAYNHSGLLEQNRALLRAADEDVATAASALLPIINWSAQAQRSFGTRYASGISSSLTDTTVQLGITAQYLLYDFGGAEASINIARETVFATREALKSLEQQILMRAVQAYFNVRRTSEFVSLRQNNERLLVQEFRAAKDRFEVGETTRTDVAMAEARLANARSGLATARGDLRQAREEYANAIGYMPKGTLKLPPLPKISMNMKKAKSLAVRKHPDMVSAQHRVSAAEYAIARAEAAMKPTVNLTGNLSVNESMIDSGATHSGSVGVTASGPIYNGGRLSSAVRKAMASRDAERANLHVLKHNLQQSVGNAYANWGRVNAALKASNQQIKASRVAFRGVREEASLGARTTLDVLNAENELLNAQAALISAQADQYITGYSILASVGRLTAKDLGLKVQHYDPEAYYKHVKNGVAKNSKRGKKLDKVLKALQKE